MGQVVVSSEEEQMVVNEDEKAKKKEEGSSSKIKWEKFLPSISIRVLLVESDDSTRQIIGALLRKCSYKVASVSDGLQAWEVLKARPHNIDLILTEVELPSISGYALLTLIMEHEICKNIPVIMMSTHDSVSTVYKCMLRGAADFLVKPIRTNELKNLWQHVWRRQPMNKQGFVPQDESVGQQKLEATAENDATSDNSISSKSCAPRQDEGVKKGSDAQSSCGKPVLEAESGSMAEVEDQLQPMQTESTAFGSRTNDHNDQVNSGKNLCPESLVTGSHALGNGSHALYQGTRLEQLNSEEDVNRDTEVGDSRGSFHNSSREAIDLIGALHNCPRPNLYVNDGANKFESAPELDLSLSRFHSDLLEDKTTYEKQMLNHSNASAFTRYVNKPQQQMSNGNVTSVPTPKEDQVNTSDHSSDNASCSNTNTKNSPLPYERKVIFLPINQTKEVENGHKNSPSQRWFPIPFPVRGVQVDVCATPSGRGSTNPLTVNAPSLSPSPSSTNQQLNSYHQFSVGVASGRNHHHPLDQNPRVSSNHSILKHDTQFESIEERAQAQAQHQVSPAADQGVSSRLCNGTAGHLNGFDCGSMGENAGNVHLDAELSSGFENGSDQGHVNHGLTRQRSIQREAALNKFRLKRKERCYEKKVRYESRKKLAEQRPRVKGQFVRQVPPDPPPKTGNCGGSLVAN